MADYNPTPQSRGTPGYSLYAQWQGKRQSLQRSRDLRREPTDAENKLWKYLRRRQVAGARFRRQQPLGPYIVDFFCYERRLVVEVDGGQHQEQLGYDEQRTAWLKAQEFRVLRFWNSEVLQGSEGVIEVIRRTLEGPHPNLPPLGEGT